MNSQFTRIRLPQRLAIVRIGLRLIFLVVVISLYCVQIFAQSTSQVFGRATVPSKPADVQLNETQPPTRSDAVPISSTAAAQPAESAAETVGSKSAQTQFRIERLTLVGGSELLTIFGRMDGISRNGLPAPEVPLVSVVRDTLADNDPENDRLRYVWMLTYTQPTLMKRIASAVPFFYQHVGSKRQASTSPPVPLINLANPDRQTWKHFFWVGLQNIFFDSYGMPLKAASRSYRRNATEYRSAHVTQALTILGNYENLRQRSRDENELLALGERVGANENATADRGLSDTTTPLLPERSPAFTPGEMLELRARLILSGKTFGGLFGPDKFAGTVEKRSMAAVDTMGHNWEMLRQRAEAEGLYFQPLTMPDGHASHVLLWVSKSDLVTQNGRTFNKRFLNIANPWKDSRLRNWNGYTQTRYFDANNLPTTAEVPGARAVEMIPLAIYGLDHPKIPALLVDFRDGLNPKKREISQRFFSDLTKNVLSLSSFGNIPYFIGRTTYNFVTGRRGMDLNQPTRLNSYTELKLLLSFNGSLDPKLDHEIARRLETVSINPLNNDRESEIILARQQYDALIDYVLRPDGLPAKIARDRREEMVPLKHGSMARFFFNLGSVVSFGHFVHRETATPELSARMEIARRTQRHTDLLNQVARSSPQTEVAWDMDAVKHSLQFLADQGAGSNRSAAHAAALIFQRTNDPEARRLCLDALNKINSKDARKDLLRIYLEEPPQSEWRPAIAERLRRSIAADARIKPAEAKTILSQVGQP